MTDVQTWIDELAYVVADEDPRITRLIAAGETAVEPLMDALDNGRYWNDYVVRTEVCYILGEIGDPRAVPTLIKAVGDGDRHVWPQAVGALKKIGQPAYEALLSGLHTTDERQLLCCLHALGELDNPDAIPFIKPLLVDSRWSIRLSAAQNLCLLGEWGSLSLIIDSLYSDDQVMVTNAVYSLARLATELSSRPALMRTAIQALSGLEGHTDAMTRNSAAYALRCLQEVV